MNLANRQAGTLVTHIDILRSVIDRVKRAHPFSMIAMTVMPDHLHAIWRLPAGDVAYPMRWSLIKSGFSRLIPKDEFIRESRLSKRERGIWQRRYWEHQIRDDDDLARHVAYTHYNPVKHGLVKQVADWPHSTFHEYVKRGMIPPDWGGIRENMEGEYGEGRI